MPRVGVEDLRDDCCGCVSLQLNMKKAVSVRTTAKSTRRRGQWSTHAPGESRTPTRCSS